MITAWGKIDNWDQHNKVKGLQSAEIHIPAQPGPKVANLAPGESYEANDSRHYPEVLRTEFERIVFTNGGSIEDDTSGDGGLLLTKPDGNTVSVASAGTVECDLSVNFSIEDRRGEPVSWVQTFPYEGGTVLRTNNHVDYNQTIEISPDGKTITQSNPCDPSYCESKAKIEGNAIVFESEGEVVSAFAPPVPLEWLIS